MEGRALGLRVKLGWALGIVVRAGDDGQPVVVARDELRFAAEDGAYAYHEALHSEPDARAEVVARAADRAADAATELLAGAVHRWDLTTVGLVVGRGVRKIPLERILASSQLFHTADAEILQGGFTEAAVRLQVPLRRVLFADAEADPAWPAISALGRTVGAPWRKDQKLAATVGWMALRRPN